jgi:hypothetical protein
MCISSIDPRVSDDDPESLAEFQRFYMVLHPDGQQRYCQW